MNGIAVPLQELQRGLAPRTGQTLAAECQKTCEWPEGRVQGTGDPRQDYGLIPKKLLHVSLGNAVYLFRFLWSVFVLPLFFCCCCNLFSTLYYSRTQQKLFGSELQRRCLDSRVHHLALLHFGCDCMVQSYRFSGMAWQSSAIPMEKVGICTGAASQCNRCRRTQTQVA